MSRALLVALLLSRAALAAELEEYGYQWPLELDPDAGALRVVLTPDVYEHLYDPALRDLEVFDADGQALPFGPVPGSATDDAAPAPTAARVELPWFAIPARGLADPGSAIRLRIERGAGGELRRLDASVPPDAASRAERSDVLVDLSAHAGRVERLELDWASAPGSDVSARFRVSASDDLVSWRPIASEVGVVELRQNGFELVRRRIDLSATSSPYLLLERSDSGAPLALTKVTGTLLPEAAGVSLQWLPARASPLAAEPGAAEFRAPGPLRVERVDLDLGAASAVARVRIASRDREDAPWVPRAELTAFRIGGASAATQEDVAIVSTRDRLWRVTSDPPLPAAPVLRLGYRPDEFVLLASGSAPFVLVGGSAVHRRADYPMALLVSELRQRRGEGWRMQPATLGALETLRGEAALAPPPTRVPIERWILWGVLVAAAGLIALFAVRLLRSAPRDPAGGP